MRSFCTHFLTALVVLLSAAAYAQPTHPMIIAISPTSGNIGSSITITGENFSTTAGNNIVYFNGMKGTVTAATATSLTVTVPTGAQYGPVSVTTANRTGYSRAFFQPVFPCGTNLSSSSFSSGTLVSTGATPEGIAAGDLDGDGKLDLVVANFTDSNAVIIRNTSTAGALDANSFTKADTLKINAHAFQVALGDLNADGKLDVILGWYSGADSISVFENTSTPGNISFAAPVNINTTSSATGNVCSMQVTDMDFDGKPDIVGVMRSQYMFIIKNNNSGSAISSADFMGSQYQLNGTTTQFNDLQIADINIDGLPDIIVPEISNARINVWTQLSAGVFIASVVNTAFNNIWGINIADIDGDGKPDISGHCRNNNAFFCFRNTSSPGLFSVAANAGFTTTGLQGIYTSASDLNGDGKPEVVVADISGGNPYIIPNNSTAGTISFGTPFTLGSTDAAIATIIADFDGDNAPDVFFPNNSTGIRAFRNQNQMNVVLSTTSPTACLGATSRNINYTANGSPTTYNLTWNAAAITAGFSNVTGGTLPASPLSISVPGAVAAGTYTATLAVSDGSCTSPTTTINLTVGAPAAFNVTGGGPACPGGSGVAIGLDGSASGVNYQLYNGASTVGSAVAGTGAAISFGSSFTAAGTYTVVATNSGSCTANMTGSAIVTSAAAPATYNVTGGGAYCSGGSGVAVGLSNSETGVNYQLFNGAATVGSAVAGTGAAISFGSQTAAGTYTVKATHATTSCQTTMTGSAIVTVNLLPTAYNVTGGGSFCAGGSGVTVGLSNSQTGKNYQLQIDGVNTGSPVGGTNGFGISFGLQTAAGSYTVIATDASTSCPASMTGSVNVTVNALPTITPGTSPSVIQGTTTANLAYTATTGSPTTYTITYDATATGAGFANVSSTALPSSPITLTVPASAPVATYNGSIRVSNGTCQSSLTPFTISVTDPNAAPSFTGGASQSMSVCRNAPAVSINSLLKVDDADNGQTLTWSVTSAASNGTVAASYSTTSTGSTVTPIGLTYTPATGYSGTDAFTVQVSDGTTTASTTINVIVTAAVSGTTVVTNVACNGGNTGAINVTASGGTSPYTFNWGNSITTEDRTGLVAGSYSVTITDANSCTGTVNATVSQPAAAVGGTTVVTNVACNGGNTGAINLTATGGTSPYTFNWGNSITTEDRTGLVAGAYSVTITDANSCTGTVNATVSQPAAAVSGTTVVTNVACNGGNTGAINLTATGGTSPYTFNWGSSITTEDRTGLVAGAYSVTITDANSCTGTVNATVSQPAAAVSGTTVVTNVACNGGNTGAINLTASGGTSPYTYNWGNSITTEDRTGLVAGSYSVTITDANSCTGTATASVTEPPAPTVNTVSSQLLCNGASTSAIVFTGTEIGTSYHWINNNTSIGLAASGTGDITAFQAVNSGNVPVIATITITPQKNGCSGASKVFTITVDPTPTVNTVSNQTLCNGATTTAIAFGGAVSGTTYNWTNNNTSIGLAAGGTGNIASFIGTNSSVVPFIGTITVTPTKGSCTGTAKTFTITVNPTPGVNTVSNQTHCNNDATAVVAFSGSVFGTSYNWANNTPSIGLAGSGSGNIGSFNTTNTGTAPVTATITVTPVASSCAGAPTSFTFTVNPTATVNTVSNQVVCNTLMVAPVNFSSPVSGTTYSWINNTPSIGLGANGNGNILSFQGINITAAPVTATITVTPTANGCVGIANNFTITVNPTPNVNAIAGQTLCNGTASAAVNFTGAVSGTTYSWSNNNTSIGLGANGTGNIASFTTANATNVPVTATINVTTSANGCAGTSGSFNITVNPTPTLVNPGAHYACNGVPLSINLAGPVAGTSFAWVNNNTSIGLAANGTGNIASFAATNTGTAPEVATVSITPSANGCTGPVSSFTITVKPIPALTSTLTPADICDNTMFNYTPTSATVGTTFAWTRQAITGISNPASLGNNNPAETLHNTTANPIVVMYRYFLYADGCGNTEYVAVTVNPTPRLNSAMSATLCSGDEFNYTPTSATAGTAYAWSRAGMNGINPAATAGTSGIKESLFNTTTGTIKVPYVYTLTANGCTGTDVVELTLHPTPQVPVISIKAPEAVCANTMYQNFGAATTAPAGSFYTWTANNAVIWSQGDDHRYALVNFPNAGTSTVTLTTTLSATGCESSASVIVNTGSSEAQQPEVIYYNGRFVCLQNDMDVYIWGYDDKGSLDSNIVPKETNQDYLNLSPDFNNKYYWVMTMKNGCAQKTYYNAPTSVDRPVMIRTEMRVYPNPATETVNFELGAANGAEVAFSVYDVAGKLIQTIPAAAGKAQADVSALAQGMYSVICTVDGSRVAVAKFVKH